MVEDDTLIKFVEIHRGYSPKYRFAWLSTSARRSTSSVVL
jgi:hypothetical protein